MDSNLVDKWLRFDPVRWVSGIISGVFAGFVAAGVASIVAKSMGLGSLFPLKYMALPVLGAGALESGFHLSAVIAGAAVLMSICGFWGLIYSHFTFTNAKGSLFGMGIAWGLFSWIFLNNLYSPSFRDIFAVQFSNWWALLFCLTYGVSLMSVAFFDRFFRGSTKVF